VPTLFHALSEDALRNINQRLSLDELLTIATTGNLKSRQAAMMELFTRTTDDARRYQEKLLALWMRQEPNSLTIRKLTPVLLQTLKHLDVPYQLIGLSFIKGTTNMVQGELQGYINPFLNELSNKISTDAMDFTEWHRLQDIVPLLSVTQIQQTLQLLLVHYQQQETEACNAITVLTRQLSVLQVKSLPGLQESLLHEDSWTRLVALKIVAVLAHQWNEAELAPLFAELQKNLWHPDYWVHKATLEIISALTPQWKTTQVEELLTGLQKNLQHEDGWVRDAALGTIVALAHLWNATHAERLLTGLEDNLRHQDSSVRKNTLKAISALAPLWNTSQRALLFVKAQENLKYQDSWVHQAALEAVAALAREMNLKQVDQLIFRLRKDLAYRDKQVRTNALEVISALASQWEPAHLMQLFPGLQENLQHPDSWMYAITLKTVNALAHKWSAAQLKLLFPGLQKNLQHQDSWVRKAAIETANALAHKWDVKQVEELFTGLQTGMRHQDVRVRHDALNGIVVLAHKWNAKQVEQLLTGLQEDLRGQDNQVRQNVLEAIAALASQLNATQVAQLLPDLEENMRHQNPFLTCKTALKAIATLASKLNVNQVIQILPELQNNLQHHDELVREATQNTIAALVSPLEAMEDPSSVFECIISSLHDANATPKISGWEMLLAFDNKPFSVTRYMEADQIKRVLGMAIELMNNKEHQEFFERQASAFATLLTGFVLGLEAYHSDYQAETEQLLHMVNSKDVDSMLRQIALKALNNLVIQNMQENKESVFIDAYQGSESDSTTEYSMLLCSADRKIPVPTMALVNA